jgi:hypothetical protein
VPAKKLMIQWGMECAACGAEFKSADHADPEKAAEEWDKEHDACFPAGVKDKQRG